VHFGARILAVDHFDRRLADDRRHEPSALSLLLDAPIKIKVKGNFRLLAFFDFKRANDLHGAAGHDEVGFVSIGDAVSAKHLDPDLLVLSGGQVGFAKECGARPAGVEQVDVLAG
jgi:hypothetical protein